MPEPPARGARPAGSPGESDLRLSIVIPVYNERESIGPLWAELQPVLHDLAKPHEVILVDDGSTDGSAEVLDRLRQESPGVRVLRTRRNQGQSSAMLAGFRAARGRVVVTLDADGQNIPADIPALLEHISEYDAVVGYRKTRADGPVKRITSRVGNAVRNRLSGDDIIDTGCTLKAFRRPCLEDLPPFRGMHRFIPTLIRMAGGRVQQIPVGHRPRIRGRSKYGVWNRLLPTLGDLMAIRWMKSRRLRLDEFEET